jgi:hypothetical protein
VVADAQIRAIRLMNRPLRGVLVSNEPISRDSCQPKRDFWAALPEAFGSCIVPRRSGTNATGGLCSSEP